MCPFFYCSNVKVHFIRKNLLVARKNRAFVRKFLLFIRKLEKNQHYFQFIFPDLQLFHSKKVPI